MVCFLSFRKFTGFLEKSSWLQSSVTEANRFFCTGKNICLTHKLACSSLSPPFPYFWSNFTGFCVMGLITLFPLVEQKEELILLPASISKQRIIIHFLRNEASHQIYKFKFKFKYIYILLHGNQNNTKVTCFNELNKLKKI